MKRQLTESEKKLTKKGITKQLEELETLQLSLSYSQDIMKKNELVLNHEDKWRSFIRAQKKKEDDGILDSIKQEIDLKKKVIEEMQKQLKEGVEVKNNTMTG